MNRHLEKITSPKSRPIIQAASRTLRAVIRVFGRELPVATLVELLQQAAVEGALHELYPSWPDDEKVNLSRLALHTGMDTRTIRRIWDRPRRMTELDIYPLAAILDHWVRDPKLRDRYTGKPMDLPIYGNTGSFQGLVNCYCGRGISSIMVAERLQESGNLVIRDRNWAVFRSAEWRWVETNVEDFLESASVAMHTLSLTLDNNNPKNKSKKEKLVERRVFSEPLPQPLVREATKEIHQLLLKQKDEMHALVNRYEALARQASEAELEGAEVVGAGYYSSRDFDPDD